MLIAAYAYGGLNNTIVMTCVVGWLLAPVMALCRLLSWQADAALIRRREAEIQQLRMDIDSLKKRGR